MADYDEPRSRRDDPDTSDNVVPVNKLRAMVYDALKQHPEGLAAIEIARLTGEHVWSISPRLQPMHEDGIVILLGKRKVLNSKGNMKNMQIWSLPPKELEKPAPLPAPPPNRPPGPLPRSPELAAADLPEDPTKSLFDWLDRYGKPR
jgi:hypothetical protein